MTESIDEFFERVDDVLTRAFPGLDADEPADAAPPEIVTKPWPVSDRRQQQLERLGNPDNESW